MIEWRELKTMEEMEDVQGLDELIWKADPVPTHQTSTAVKNGGIMLGLYDGKKLIGFSYGFPGFKNGNVYLCSHMLGIHPNYQSQGFGEKLKQKQREVALAKGYERIHWTFDPLETRNGYLNLSKLNGICHTYVENCYGEMKDKLNKGLPSDRFEVHWHINSPYVTENQQPLIDGAIPLNSYTVNEVGLPTFKHVEEKELTADVYSLVVPKDFQSLKADDKELALDWRYQTREKFQQLFQAGYTTVRNQPEEIISTYYFVKKSTLELGG